MGVLYTPGTRFRWRGRKRTHKSASESAREQARAPLAPKPFSLRRNNPRVTYYDAEPPQKVPNTPDMPVRDALASHSKVSPTQ